MAAEVKPGAKDTPTPPAATSAAAAVVDEKKGGAAAVVDDKAGAQTPEQIAAAKKTADDAAAATAETKRKADEAAAASKAPEKYVLAIPKGAESYLDKSDIDAIATVAKAEGWTNEEAQERLEQHADSLAAQSETFKSQTLADATYGGDKLEETQRLAQRTIDRVRPTGHARREGFTKLLAKSGYGNNLEVIAFLADLGKLMAEDTTIAGSGGGGGVKKDAADVLYGGTK